MEEIITQEALKGKKSGGIRLCTPEVPCFSREKFGVCSCKKELEKLKEKAQSKLF